MHEEVMASMMSPENAVDAAGNDYVAGKPLTAKPSYVSKQKLIDKLVDMAEKDPLVYFETVPEERKEEVIKDAASYIAGRVDALCEVLDIVDSGDVDHQELDIGFRVYRQVAVKDAPICDECLASDEWGCYQYRNGFLMGLSHFQNLLEAWSETIKSERMSSVEFYVGLLRFLNTTPTRRDFMMWGEFLPFTVSKPVKTGKDKHGWKFAIVQHELRDMKVKADVDGARDAWEFLRKAVWSGELFDKSKPWIISEPKQEEDK
jgi:hypothetical protein